MCDMHPLCKGPSETIQHVFMECPLARIIWRNSKWPIDSLIGFWWATHPWMDQGHYEASFHPRYSENSECFFIGVLFQSLETFISSFNSYKAGPLRRPSKVLILKHINLSNESLPIEFLEAFSTIPLLFML